jgi:transmembrane sensor
MEYNNEQVAELILKYKTGDLSAEEGRLLEEWLKASANREYFNAILKDRFVWDKEHSSNTNSKRIWEKINAGLEESPVIPLTGGFNWKKIAVAASIFIAVGLSGWLVWNNKNKVESAKPLASVSKNDLAPGADRATLTMDDGRIIDLTRANAGKVAEQAGVSIEKTKDGQLLYRAERKTSNAQPMEQFAGTAAMNMVSTPRGGQYQVLLPDETSVWLNAASSIRFPSVFSGTNRKVEITGEAYFEVKKDPARPFIVKINDAEITVLGTHFNVMGYPEEGTTQTTLLEGSVRISHHAAASQSDNTPKPGNTVTLKPGQQATINKNGQLDVAKDINMDLTVAWVNGYFQFKNQDIGFIMRQISRWYNVDISYKSGIPPGKFTGKISRNTNASEVIKMFQIGGLEYTVEGNKLIIQ